MNPIILTFIIIIIAVLISNPTYKEHFADPYSLYYHADMINRHERWRETHRKAFYWHKYYTPQHYKE